MSEYEALRDLVTFRPLERPIALVGRRRSPFSAPWGRTVELLGREVKMLRPKTTIMEIDLRETDFRNDGLPRADRAARSSGIVLTMLQTRHGHPHLRYEVAEFDRWQDNVRAIALGLEALRAVDRYGVTRRGEQYAGWKALPVGSGAPSADRGRELVGKLGGMTAAMRATHPDTREDGYTDRDFEDVQAYRELVATR